MEPKQELEPIKFTRKELQVFVALLGIFSVCGCAAYLNNGWVVFGLLPVAIIVGIVGKV